MVDLYFTLIKNKMRTLSQVPVKFQPDVQMKLTDAGLDENGDPVTA